MIGSNVGNIPLLLPEDYIGSQILQSLLARYHLILTRTGDEELSIAPSNVNLASLSPANFLVPTMAVNNILLGMGLHLTVASDGSYDIQTIGFGAHPIRGDELRLPGDEPNTKRMDTSLV